MDFSQFIGTFILGKVLFSVYKRDAERMCQECEPFIEKGSKILDLGCGRGIKSDVIRNYFQAEMLGVDIQDQRVIDLPFQIIDGENLPFPDNYFDVVLISYVLHHAANPLQLLKEAKRVSKNKIIIYEDLEETGLAQIACWFHKTTYKISAPFQKNLIEFHSRKEWEEIFNKLGLKIIFQERVNPRFKWIYPAKYIRFVLEK